MSSFLSIIIFKIKQILQNNNNEVLLDNMNQAQINNNQAELNNNNQIQLNNNNQAELNNNNQVQLNNNNQAQDADPSTYWYFYSIIFEFIYSKFVVRFGEFRRKKIFKIALYHITWYLSAFIIFRVMAKMNKYLQIIHYINKQIQAKLPVMFFSFQDFSLNFTLEKFQQFQQKNIYWNYVQRWRDLRQLQFNELYQKRFGKYTSLTVVIDEINAISKFCQYSKCLPIVSTYINKLYTLSRRGARVIFLSSDDQQDYLSDINMINFGQFNQHEIKLQPKTDFVQMFNDYQLYDEQLRNYILDHYEARGKILQVLKQYNVQKKDSVKLKQYINKNVQRSYWYIFKRHQSINLLKNVNVQKHVFQQFLLKICLQTYNPDIIRGNQEQHLQYYLKMEDIIYKDEFKNKLQVRAFQKYSKLNMNQTVICKQFKDLQQISTNNQQINPKTVEQNSLKKKKHIIDKKQTKNKQKLSKNKQKSSKTLNYDALL